MRELVDLAADVVLMRAAECVLKMRDRIARGELRDPGTIEALGLVAQALIGATDVTQAEAGNAAAN